MNIPAYKNRVKAMILFTAGYPANWIADYIGVTNSCMSKWITLTNSSEPQYRITLDTIDENELINDFRNFVKHSIIGSYE
jgi:hypothetical protein